MSRVSGVIALRGLGAYMCRLYRSAERPVPVGVASNEQGGSDVSTFSRLHYLYLYLDGCSVGLPEGTAESLDKTSPDWRVSGKYAVVSYAPRKG